MEAAQVFLLNRAVSTIKNRVDTLVPEGKKGGDLLAEAAIEFMGLIGKDGPDGDRARAVVGTFIRSASVAAVDTALERMPAAKAILSNATGGASIGEVLPKKYRWMGQIIDLVGPQLAAAAEAQQAQRAAAPKQPEKVKRAW